MLFPLSNAGAWDERVEKPANFTVAARTLTLALSKTLFIVIFNERNVPPTKLIITLWRQKFIYSTTELKYDESEHSRQQCCNLHPDKKWIAIKRRNVSEDFLKAQEIHLYSSLTLLTRAMRMKSQ